jgi:hypothetical protein
LIDIVKVFETVVIDSVGIGDDVVDTVWKLATFEMVDFFSEISVLVARVHEIC